MRIEGTSFIAAWFHRVFPPRIPRECHLPLNNACYRVRPPEYGACANKYAYWSYLERQNIRDSVQLDAAPAPVPPRFGACRPDPACHPHHSHHSHNDHHRNPALDDSHRTGLAGDPIGRIPVAHDHHPAPKAPPQQIDRIREPGVLGSIIDVIA